MLHIPATAFHTCSLKYHFSTSDHFYPTALKGCRGIVFTHGGRREKVCPGCISETVRCRKLILGTLVRMGRCATSWSDLDLTFDLAVVTLSLKILCGLYLGNRKV